MNKFTLSQLALDDLKSIARYTEGQWGQGQRNIYLKQFDDTFHMLADTPSLGMACDLILQGYKKFPQASHMFFIESWLMMLLKYQESCTKAWMLIWV